MPRPAPFPPPPRRAATFAEAVRGRVRPRPARVLGDGWAALDGRPSTAERVLRVASRPGATHLHRHAGAQLNLRLAVAFGVTNQWRPERTRTIWRTAPATAPGPTGNATSIPPAAGARPRPTPIGVLLARAGATTPDAVTRLSSRATTPDAAARPSSRATAPAVTAVRRGRGAATGPYRAASPVAMTHRAPAATTAAPPQRPAAGAPQPLGVAWATDPAPGRVGAQPLTAADLPSVIDRVVGELDRRVTAARERRGWTS